MPGRSLRRFWRRLRLHAAGGGARVVYSPDYSRGLPGVPLDPLRADKIAGFLRDEHLVPRSHWRLPREIRFEELLRVHDPAYLASLADPRVVTRVLGVTVTAGAAEQALAEQRLQAGGTLRAARDALATGRSAINLGGGFHHAGRASGSGFCLVNDVAAAVAAVRAEGFKGRVLVVDLDVHDGNGTRELLAADPLARTLSIHRDDWGEAVPGHVRRALGPGVDGPRLMAALEDELPSLVERFPPQLAFYVAGADVLAGDALGDWRLRPEDVLARDRFVVSALRGVPLVVTLAGGYGTEAWRCAARLCALLLSGKAVEPPGDAEADLRRLRRLARELLPVAEEPWLTLTEADVLPPRDQPGPPLFLEKLSRHALELSLERSGLLAQIRARGFVEPRVELLADSGLGTTLSVWSEADELLVELRAHRSRAVVPDADVLFIEWLLMQNPRAAFAPDRPALPNQRHPGLGLLRSFLGWLAVIAELEALDGVAFAPSAWHTAVLSRSSARFLDPEGEARLLATGDALTGLPVHQAAQALLSGEVVDEAGQRVDWQPSTMVIPIRPALRARLSGHDRAEAVAAARCALRWRRLSRA